MQHTIPISQLGPTGEGMAHAVETCVHCGFCLPTCPTYVTLGEEMDSPRGRIVLMKSALEGALAVKDTLPFVDRCLGCMACVTACPSGVPYAELLAPYRARTEKERSRTLAERLTRRLVRETLPYPSRFRLAAATGKLVAPLRRLLPASWSAMLSLLPDRLPQAKPLPSLHPAEGPRRARVALLAGCVQQVLAPEINQATLRVLARHGIETVVPGGQGCCGSLMLHNGDDVAARDLARRNLRVFPKDVDAILTNAAGCGSGMKAYGLLFRGHSEEDAARACAARVRDVTEFLADFEIESPPAQPMRLAYHDACHLAHGQKIRQEPRRLLKTIPGLRFVELKESDFCCGSAGIYNLLHPDVAQQLLDRKIERIRETGVDVVVSGNPGCSLQIEKGIRERGLPIRVMHPVELLDWSYRGRML